MYRLVYRIGIKALPVIDRIEAMQTPFVLGPRGLQSLSLTLDASMAPFFVNFVLLKPLTTGQEDIWIR